MWIQCEDLFFFVSIWTFIVEGVEPQKIAQDIPDNDYYNDPAFDDIFYQMNAVKNHANFTEEQCVQECNGSDKCNGFFYQARDQTCKPIWNFFIVNNDAVVETRIRQAPGFRLYRLIPSARLGSCPLDKCFYYHKESSTCYKVIYDTGPQSGGKFTYNDARAACEADGARLLALDETTFKAMRFYLVDIKALTHDPAVLPRYKELYVGAHRVTNEYVWSNGQTVTEVRQDMWTTSSWNTMNKDAGKDCIIFTRYQDKNAYRLKTHSCTQHLHGAICEMPAP